MNMNIYYIKVLHEYVLYEYVIHEYVLHDYVLYVSYHGIIRIGII